MEKEFELIKIKFEAAENAAEMALKRSYKDKKEYFELYNHIEQIVEANKERSKKNVEFVKQISLTYTFFVLFDESRIFIPTASSPFHA